MGEQAMTAYDYEFMKYITEYGKHFATKAEYEFRAAPFKENLAHIEAHNAKGTESHTLGINHMMEWTEEEYRKLLGYKPEIRLGAKNSEPTLLDTSNLADDFNWVTKGAVTAVKNQE